MTLRRSLLPALLVAGALSATLASPALTATTLTATTRNIKIGDDYFVRDGKAPTIAVKSGTTVKWLWRGDSPHNVTVSKGPTTFKSKTMTEGFYSKVLTHRGTYRIYCSIHGAADQSMILQVK